MNEVFMNAQRAAILSAYEQCYSEGHDLWIKFMVTNEDGDYNPNITFPIGTDFDLNESGKAKAVHIKLGANACKYFGLDDETGDFVYDVGVNGRPFLGNIPVQNVMDMAVMGRDNKPEFMCYINPMMFLTPVKVEVQDDAYAGVDTPQALPEKIVTPRGRTHQERLKASGRPSLSVVPTSKVVH